VIASYCDSIWGMEMLAGEQAKGATLLVASLQTHCNREGCSEVLHLAWLCFSSTEPGEGFGESRVISNNPVGGTSKCMKGKSK